MKTPVQSAFRGQQPLRWPRLAPFLSRRCPRGGDTQPPSSRLPHPPSPRRAGRISLTPPRSVQSSSSTRLGFLSPRGRFLLVCRFSGIGERMKVYTQAKCTLWKPESVRCISKFGKLKTKTKTKQTAKRLRNIRGCFAKLSTWIMTILFSRIPGRGLSLPARLRDEETEAHRGQVHAANEWQSWD